MDVIRCIHCGFTGNKEFLERSCGNCFACMGCEIYICPQCQEEIVVRPFREERRKTLRERNRQNSG